MCNAAERGQFQTPDTPRITAISDISRPIPENNAIETSGFRHVRLPNSQAVKKSPALRDVLAPAHKVQWTRAELENTSPR
jgi:hypothetical protein